MWIVGVLKPQWSIVDPNDDISITTTIEAEGLHAPKVAYTTNYNIFSGGN